MVDILFLAHKRPGFTRASMDALLVNTPDLWEGSKVEGTTLSIYTDADPDPSYSFNLALTTNAPIWRVSNQRHGGPVACMVDFLQRTAPGACNDPDGKPHRAPEATPEFIAKIDNDCIVSPGWLPACLDLMRRFPNVDLLGIEPWTPDQTLFPRDMRSPKQPEEQNWFLNPRIVSHIGGIGLFRRSAFERFGRPTPNTADGRFGFTEFQWQHKAMVKAFIDPPLPVFLLDHLPFEPWRSLSRRYEQEGIQRNVGWEYDVVRHRALWGWAFASGGLLNTEGQCVGGSQL